MTSFRRLATLVLMIVFLVIAAAAEAAPVVFWASDNLQPGDAVLLHGDGLAELDSLRVWRLPDDASAPGPAKAPPAKAPESAVVAKALQPSRQSVKVPAAGVARGGGVVDFPWGTYRLTGWIRIPPKTVLRGENRDATILEWSVDDPKNEKDFAPAAVFGDTSYAIETLSLVARNVNAILHDLGSASGVPPELRDRIAGDGSHDVFLRRVAFHHWMLCGHPDRNPALASRMHGTTAWNFTNSYGSIRTFEVSDCLFQGGSQQFSNIRNARITGNSFSNAMGQCWTCLGGGAWFTVAERNDLRCSSSWGYGLIGLNRIYPAHNSIRHADVGIFVGGSTTNVLASRNRFEEVATPIVCNPGHCTVVP
jgi:hypothetical protein